MSKRFVTAAGAALAAAALAAMPLTASAAQARPAGGIDGCTPTPTTACFYVYTGGDDSQLAIAPDEIVVPAGTIDAAKKWTWSAPNAPKLFPNSGDTPPAAYLNIGAKDKCTAATAKCVALNWVALGGEWDPTEGRSVYFPCISYSEVTPPGAPETHYLGLQPDLQYKGHGINSVGANWAILHCTPQATP